MKRNIAGPLQIHSMPKRMDSCLDTTRTTQQQLQEYARQLLIFINQYDWLTHAYVVEYFKKNHWNSLPSSWQHCLQGLTPPQVAKYITDPTASTPARCVWPLSLLAYKATVKALSIPRHMAASKTECEPEVDHSHCYRLHVKPKKRYEIDNLARVINSTCQSSHCNRIVDVGSGQGHLSRLLSFGYGLPVTSIEAVGCHITGAAKFDREVKDFIEKKKRKGEYDNEPLLPKHVVCTVHPQITVEEFLSVIDTSCKQHQTDCTSVRQRDDSIPSSPSKKSRTSVSDSSYPDKDHDNKDNNVTTLSKVLPEGQTCNETENSYLLAGLHTCGDLAPTMLRVFAKCPSVHALASVACCYMKMSCAIDNSLIKGKSKQSCDSPPAAATEVIDNPNPMTETRADTLHDEATKAGSGIPGFPMSEWVKGQKRCNLDFQPLELGCHSFDAYCKRLKDNDPNLVLQGYRAVLEILIQRQCPELQYKHAVIRKIKRVISKMKKTHNIPFEQYAATALKKLDLTYDATASNELGDALLPQWHNLVVYHSLRLMIGPLIEALVLVDRMLFLLELGIDSKLVPIFDPNLSPRNFVLLATKRH